jgi:hypothetical protein
MILDYDHLMLYDIPLKVTQNWSRVLQRIETCDEFELQENEVILQTLSNLYLK